MTAAAAPPRYDAGFLVRTTALGAALSMPLARVIAPGLRGIATDSVVVTWQIVAATISYALAFLLGAVAAEGAAGLLRRDTTRGLRGLVLVGTLVTMALVAPAFVRRLPPQPEIVLILSASIVVLATSSRALGMPKLRAAGLVMALFALAALVRLFAWQLAVAAGEQVSDRLYTVSRVIATAGVVFEAAGQLAAVAWLGTRGKLTGQVLAVLSVISGFGLTWAATMGMHHEATTWQVVLHTAFLEAQTVPPPFGLSAASTFLLAASYPLALLAAAQRGASARGGCVLALALLAHGSFDAPIRALAAVAAAVALLSSDD